MKFKNILIFIILFITLQASSTADEASDFEIDGISIGDSLLEFYSLEEIQSEIKDGLFYPKSKKMKIISFKPINKNSLYEEYNIHIKNNDANYIIFSIKGLVKSTIDKCLEKKNDVISEIEGQINYKKKDDYVGNYGKEFGNSAAHISDFIFDNGDNIRVWCTEWDFDNKNVINYGYRDNFSVSISSEEQIKFIQNEAY